MTTKNSLEECLNLLETQNYEPKIAKIILCSCERLLHDYDGSTPDLLNYAERYFSVRDKLKFK